MLWLMSMLQCAVNVQLLNQLAVSGPEPASEQQISRLPLASFSPNCFGKWHLKTGVDAKLSFNLVHRP